jgi:hypothetical protein
MRVLKFTDSQGQKTLEKEDNLVSKDLDKDLPIDPLFRQIR